MEERFLRNIPALTPGEMEGLRQKRVLICGCGGLGGWLVELMARLGVGHITAVDGDRFAESDLNRQLLATRAALGKNKAAAACERVIEIAPDMSFRAIEDFMTAENARELCAGHDLVLDGLDSPEGRLMLEAVCTALNIPLVHGAVEGWRVQAATVMPGSGVLRALYGVQKAPEEPVSCLPFTAAFCAAVQSAEAALLLCGREPTLAGRVRVWDLASGEATAFETL